MLAQFLVSLFDFNPPRAIIRNIHSFCLAPVSGVPHASIVAIAEQAAETIRNEIHLNHDKSQK